MTNVNGKLYTKAEIEQAIRMGEIAKKASVMAFVAAADMSNDRESMRRIFEAPADAAIATIRGNLEIEKEEK